MTTFLIGFLLTVHVLTCILLLLIILMQQPRSEGLGTAFGGGVADTLFGSNAGNVLTKITTGLTVTFFLTTFSLAWLYSHRNTSTDLERRLRTPVAAEMDTNAPFASTNGAPITLPLQPANKQLLPLTPSTSTPTTPESPKAPVKDGKPSK